MPAFSFSIDKAALQSLHPPATTHPQAKASINSCNFLECNSKRFLKPTERLTHPLRSAPLQPFGISVLKINAHLTTRLLSGALRLPGTIGLSRGRACLNTIFQTMPGSWVAKPTSPTTAWTGMPAAQNAIKTPSFGTVKTAQDAHRLTRSCWIRSAGSHRLCGRWGWGMAIA